MEQKQIFKQMIDFNKNTFNNTFHAMVTIQDQTEKMVNSFLAQASWLPEEGREAIDEWVNSYKQGREHFKELVDENFKKVEDFFAQTEKGTKAKTGKTAKA
jgi:uncharacterized lipoprotein NlpE involved in copper resistance